MHTYEFVLLLVLQNKLKNKLKNKTNSLFFRAYGVGFSPVSHGWQISCTTDFCVLLLSYQCSHLIIFYAWRNFVQSIWDEVRLKRLAVADRCSGWTNGCSCGHPCLWAFSTGICILEPICPQTSGSRDGEKNSGWAWRHTSSPRCPGNPELGHSTKTVPVVEASDS